MAAELRVDLEALSRAGNALIDHGQSLLDVQQSCHRAADGAQAGWVGSSSGTLAKLLNRWAVTSAAHRARFDDHANGLRVAAVALLMMEQYGANHLR